MAEIKVKISGDASELVDEAKKAQAATDRLADGLDGLGDAADDAKAGLGGLGGAAGKAAAGTKPLAKSVKDTNDALKQLKPGSNQAGNALLNLGRIAQDAPFGFIGISNNINPLLESFQRLKTETGTTGGALKALGSSLAGGAGLGLAVSVVTGLLTVFSGALFGSGEAADKAEAKLKDYQDTIEGIKYAVDSFQSQSDFDLKFAEINNQIRDFGQDGKNSLLALQQQLSESYGVINRINKGIEEANANRIKVIEDKDLPKDKRLEAEEAATQGLADLQKKQRDALQNQQILISQIRLQGLTNDAAANEKAKSQAEKAAAEQEGILRRTIDQAKKLSAYLNERTFRNFDIDFNPLDSLQKQFEQAAAFINKATSNQRGFAIKLNAVPQVTFDVNNADFLNNMQVEGAKIAKSLADTISKLPKQKLLLNFEADLKGQADQFKALQDAIFGQDRYAGFDSITADALRAADNINSVLTPAFNNLFDAIAARENPLKAFFQSIGQSIQQLIQKLIAAAVQALILQAILPPGTSSALGGFGGIFKGLLGARANGGGVLAGRTYLVGERGPELFTAPGSGRIVPNGHLNSGLEGITGGGPQLVHVIGEISGRNIRLVQTRQQGYENRNA